MIGPIDKAKRCYIIIVNYNGWKDTIECLESALKSDYKAFRIIVCDNGSPNDSWTRMIQWAEGEILASCSSHPKIENLVYPLIDKPVDFETRLLSEKTETVQTTHKVTFLKLPTNLGFAGGMNVGIRTALQDKECQYIWCLNNDTVVEPTVMSNMIRILEKNKECGICSSYSRPYNEPDMVDKGDKRIHFNKWFGNNIHYIENEKTNLILCYFECSSFIVTRDFIENVGLMEERYFLYYEEPDWTIRGARKGYKVTFYPEGIVYHKGGQSTGGKTTAASYLADYYLIRGRILITRKFFPYCIPTVYMGFIGTIIHRIQRKQYGRIWMILKLMINPKPLLKVSK